MNGMLLLACAFAVLVLLAAILVLRTGWGWWVKLGGVLAVALLAAITWRSYPGMQGWATAFSLPTRFRLDGVFVEEPNKSTNAPGAIYLWVTTFGETAGLPKPRAFVLPYNADLQVRVMEAAGKLRKNLPQLGEVLPTDPDAPGADGHGPKIPNLRFYDLPDPLFPER